MSAPALEIPTFSPAAPSPHFIRELPILVIFPHSRCNCRCVMCDIWRIRQVREITLADLEGHLSSLRQLKVRWVVFSGGEPLMHSHLPLLARLLRGEGIRTTLLTAGLILAQHAAAVAEHMDDIIVSLDGPPEVHDRIRGLAGAYHRLEKGIQACRRHRASISIHGRCTIQKENFRHLSTLVRAAHQLKLDSLSFLAADLASEAFNRAAPWQPERMSRVALNVAEVEEFHLHVAALIRDFPREITAGFIRENPDKLWRIVEHFRAHLGQVPPMAPRCNAPWVSAVIESDGSVRPCFFHRPFGRIQDGTLAEIVNNPEAIRFRSQLDVSGTAVCQKCVCSLYHDSGPLAAQADKGIRQPAIERKPTAPSL